MKGTNTFTHMLPKYEGQNGCRKLCQEYDKDEQEELHKKNKKKKNIDLLL